MDSPFYRTSVQFDFLFARAFRSIASAPLPGQILVGMGKPRQGVFQSRQFNLKARFLGQGPGGKNLYDEFGSVVYLLAGEFFPISLLAGRQGVIEYNGPDVLRFCDRCYLIGLACADEKAGSLLPEFYGNRSGNLEAEGFSRDCRAR